MILILTRATRSSLEQRFCKLSRYLSYTMHNRFLDVTLIFSSVCNITKSIIDLCNARLDLFVQFHDNSWSDRATDASHMT